jgi:hypothetical protein
MYSPRNARPDCSDSEGGGPGFSGSRTFSRGLRHRPGIRSLKIASLKTGSSTLRARPSVPNQDTAKLNPLQVSNKTHNLSTDLRLNHSMNATMSAADWEDLKEEICTQLLLGKENGEAELETMARIVWLERRQYLTLTLSERLQQFYEVALEAVEKPEPSLVDRERGIDFPKGKLLKWKTRSHSLGASSSPHPPDPCRPDGLWCKHESELDGSDLRSQFALMQQARHSRLQAQFGLCAVADSGRTGVCGCGEEARRQRSHWRRMRSS